MSIFDRSKASKVKIRNTKYKTFTIYGAVVFMFLIGFIGMISYVNKYKQEVDVVSFNQNMLDRALVEEVLMSKMSIPKKGFHDGMVEWKDREQYIGKYTSHFIRLDTPVYEDMFTEEQALRTAYLYNLDTDEELVTFPYEISKAGGKLVTPGDRLRVRGSYAMKGEKDAGKQKIVSEIIFDVVEVQDLLNSSNESIVDVIDDANRLPQKDRQELMKSEEFISKVTPKAILMVVKTKDVSKYVEFQSAEDPTYTITLLTRNKELQSKELNTGNSLLQLLNQVKQRDTANTKTDS